MSAGGIPDLLSFVRSSRAVADMRARAQTARTEYVTGRHENITQAVKGDTGSVHLLKKALDDARAYKTNLAIAEGRTARTQAALGYLTTDASEIAANALAALGRGDAASLRRDADVARGALIGIFSALNATDGGRALFGGDAVASPTLADPQALLGDVAAILAGSTTSAQANAALDAYFNHADGGFYTNIYRGGANDAPAVEISPGLRIPASARADAQPIKDMIRSLAVLASYGGDFGGGEAQRDALAGDAARATLAAGSEITNLRAALGVAESRIAGARERHEAEETALSILFTNRVTRDPYEAAAQLQLLESQLEAAYVTTSRLSQLTLSNFLR